MVSDDVYMVGDEGWSYGWWVMMVCGCGVKERREQQTEQEKDCDTILP